MHTRPLCILLALSLPAACLRRNMPRSPRAGATAGGKRPARTVVLVAFTGEEFGLLGSAHYAASPGVPPERTRAMLNMDAVSRLEQEPLLAYGTETASECHGLRAPASAPGHG